MRIKQPNIYESKENWKIALIAVLILIVIGSILYTNYLAENLAKEEKKKVELLASVFKKLNSADADVDISFMFEVIKSNETVPLILTTQDNGIIAYRNIDSTLVAHDSTYLRKLLLEMSSKNEPIRIELSNDTFNYIYYKDSYLLTQLIYFPYIQFAIILLFMIVAYFAFSSARRAEQNRVWVGMAKETAHQIGTPLNSLTGWIDYLRESMDEELAKKVIPEMEKDIERLVTVTDRFSKIGSTPSLHETEVVGVLNKLITYFKKRSSHQVNWQFNFHNNEEYIAHLNVSLFEWVLENLIKNSLDAMEGKGNIIIELNKEEDRIIIDVIDNGKGIPAGHFSKIFKPGFSSKKRGWGLGLSLSKRIIEEYHHGKIFVQESIPFVKTQFRIILYL
jgi:signal transduction histidine kinase